VVSAWRTTQLKSAHQFLGCYPYLEVGILGSPLMHLGGHGKLGTNLHTRIYNLKFHPTINNNGTHQVGKPGLHSTNILGFKDGEEGITKGTLKLHLSLCPTILILNFHRTLCNLCQVLFHHLYLLFHNNNCKNIRMQAPRDQIFYRHNQCPIPIISSLNLFTMLRCKPSRCMLFLLFHCRRFN
jgi:hypothetical protein